MRLFLAHALLASATLAQSQTPEQQLQTAYDKLRAQTSLFMRLDGTESIGSFSHHILVDCYWNLTPSGAKNISRSKIQFFRDDVQRFLAIGDGTNFWSLDLGRNEYTVNVYGSYTSKQPDAYQQTLLQSEVAQSNGPGVFPARILRDVYGGTAATFKTWVPGATPTEANNVITYSQGNPLLRQVQYVLNASTGELSSISYLDVKGNQQVSWTMSFFTFLSEPADWNFTFVPPANSRVVAEVIH